MTAVCKLSLLLQACLWFRRTNQKIIIADDIEIAILEIGRNRVRFGIQAPTNVAIQTKLQSLPEPETTSEGTDQSPRTMAAGQSGGKL